MSYGTTFELWISCQWYTVFILSLKYAFKLILNVIYTPITLTTWWYSPGSDLSKTVEEDTIFSDMNLWLRISGIFGWTRNLMNRPPETCTFLDQNSVCNHKFNIAFKGYHSLITPEKAVMTTIRKLECYNAPLKLQW